MKLYHALAAVLLAASASSAFAGNGDTNSLSGKAMQDLPGNNGSGKTTQPTGKPSESSLSGQAMHDHPGNNGAGNTASPQAKPDESSISGKAMRDLPGNK